MQEEQGPRPWIAGALSVLLPGLGHLYAGDVRASVRSYVMFLLVGVVAVLALFLPVPHVNIIIALLTALAAYAVVVRSALELARERSQLPTPRRLFQRWYSVLAVAVVFVLFIQPIVLFVVKRAVGTSLVSTSGAMAPTIIEGDHFVVTPHLLKKERGPVVVFSWPDEGGARFLMRIVGQPRDTVEMKNGILSVNGVEERSVTPTPSPMGNIPVQAMQWQREYYLGRDNATYRPTANDWGPLVVPGGQFFVLGDNRGDSYDSRFKGFVPAEHIHAQARTIYFARDPATKAIRWSRIGLVIR
jgi:signal peptidase I